MRRKKTVKKFCAEKVRQYGRKYKFILVVNCVSDAQCMKEYPMAPGLFTISVVFCLQKFVYIFEKNIVFFC